MSSFADVTALLDYPMFVVTTASATERSGCLVGFVTQVSIDPARVLVGLSDKNHTFRVAGEATALAVHLLRADQLELAELFGGSTGDEVDKFAACAWHDGPLGVPVLDDAPAWFTGAIADRYPLGDHVAFVVEPSATEVPPTPFDLLTFQHVRHLDPGHEA